MKTTIEVLRETVRPSVTYEQRLRWDDASCESAVPTRPLALENWPYLYSDERNSTGKLIVVERTVTERIVGEYTINKDGSLKNDKV